MSEIDKAIKRLKSEGYSSKDILNAISKMKEDTLKQPLIKGNLDEFLKSYTDENSHGEEIECELCMVDGATTTVEYHGANWDVCERCKALAESE